MLLFIIETSILVYFDVGHLYATSPIKKIMTDFGIGKNRLSITFRNHCRIPQVKSYKSSSNVTKRFRNN